MIRLDPAKLLDADLDLRYEIPDQLSARLPGLIVGDGYDYEHDGHAMHIYLRTPDLDRALPQVTLFLETERLRGNDLSQAAQVGICLEDSSRVEEFEIVYPPGLTGVILPVTP